MRRTRRELLGGSALALAGLAGCSGPGGDATETETGTETDASTATGGDGDSGDGSEGSDGGTAPPDPLVATAAEWTAMRARVRDALSMGLAGEAGAGASVAGDVFARFENAGGEYGAHEGLERTDEAAYEAFEEALGEMRTAGLAAGDVGRAREEAGIATDRLASATRAAVGEDVAGAFDLFVLGATATDAADLATVGNVEGAGAVAEALLSTFEEAAVHDALETADAESYEAFEGALEGIVSAAGSGDAGTVESEATAAFDAAVAGAYALAEDEHAAGAGHVAALQARGWDAAALAGAGGPSTAFAHAAALTVYRARVRDAAWLAARGETDRAATAVSDTFAHFEGARAHEALEEADGEAYEGFEAGLDSLSTAIEDGDAAGIDDAVATVDENLIAGISALAGDRAPLLEAAFFRTRFADARELYRLGATDVAAATARDLFERFEADELGIHEAVESTSEQLYAAFEEEHLSGLIEAFESADDSGVATHYEGVTATLADYATQAGTTATVSAGEAAYVAARGFDAAAVAALGEDGRAAAVAQATFEHFEAGAGGYHEALEAADAETYEAFEAALGSIRSAAEGGEDAYPPAKTFNGEVVASAYAVVESAGGSNGEAAAGVVADAFARFENARVHELLEEADHNAYETFEAQLDAYSTALSEGGDVAAAADGFARAATYAQFALVDAAEEFPYTLRLGGPGAAGGESSLQGGPNVVEGVPEDADHVVEMNAVAFAPTELTVSRGDTVAFAHAAGEAHNVVAYEEEIPDGAGFWASGGFDSESAAREGWENGRGAVQSGQSYVHTFETTGTHRYFCTPHEAAGMVGRVIVE